MLPDQRLELRHQPRQLPDREIGIDPILERLKPRLLQPRDLSLRKPLVRKIGQRRTAPGRQRPTQELSRAAPIAGP